MNKNRRLAALSAAAVILSAVFYFQTTASAAPGDASDPVVTKNYVDAKIDQITAMIQNLTPGGGSFSPAEREAVVADSTRDAVIYMETVYGDILRQAQASVPGGDVFSAVRASAGQTIIGTAGTEIILRGGTAAAVTGVNGLCDVTAGTDLTNGMNIPRNHLLIIPAADGRGIRCASEVYLMIKGGFFIVE